MGRGHGPGTGKGRLPEALCQALCFQELGHVSLVHLTSRGIVSVSQGSAGYSDLLLPDFSDLQSAEYRDVLGISLELADQISVEVTAPYILIPSPPVCCFLLPSSRLRSSRKPRTFAKMIMRSTDSLEATCLFHLAQ